jgi:hypothetical protein
LKEEAEEQIKMSDKKSAISDSEKRSIDKMKDALDVSQELIVRELEELEHHKKEGK